jgi:hypothetical protein
MPILSLNGGAFELDYSTAAGSVAPSDAYTAWATELGVSTTETLRDFNADDTGFAFIMAAPFFDGGTTTAMFSSEGGIGLHNTEPTNTGSTAYTITNLSRMYGLASRPRLLLTFRVTDDLKSYATKLQRSGSTTIIYGQYSKFNNESVSRYDAAIKITPQNLEFIGRTYDSAASIYWTELNESTVQTVIQQALAQSQTAGTIINLDATVKVPVKANIAGPALLSSGNASLQAWFGDLVRSGYVTANAVLGSPQVSAVAYPMGYVEAPSVLAQPAVLGQFVAQGWVDVGSVFGSTNALGNVYPVGSIASPSILGACNVLAHHDFTGQLGDTVTRYVMDLVTPTGTVRVPISSWQATLQTGRSNYVQCVAPGVLNFVSAINAATEFVVSRTATLPDGTVIEYEMARSPVGEARFDRGANRFTCTLSGYSPGFAMDDETFTATDRTLERIRNVSSGSGGLRVRCAVDWLLRPGHRAFVDGSPFVVAYINYYVGGGDAYMETGERL